MFISAIINFYQQFINIKASEVFRTATIYVSNQLIPWCRVLVRKPTTQLVKKFPTFYRTQNFMCSQEPAIGHS
jgi:hypothetical protein